MLCLGNEVEMEVVNGDEVKKDKLYSRMQGYMVKEYLSKKYGADIRAPIGIGVCLHILVYADEYDLIIYFLLSYYSTNVN